MGERIINQAKPGQAKPGQAKPKPAKGPHGGARPGAGRPKGARDLRTVRTQADVAAIVARIELDRLMALTPVDVLRLAMLMAVRRGDIEAGANYARQLLGVWHPSMARVAGPGVDGGSKTAGTVNALLEELGDVPDAGPSGEARKASRMAQPESEAEGDEVLDVQHSNIPTGDWLEAAVASVVGELGAEPGRALSLDDVRARLAAEYRAARR